MIRFRSARWSCCTLVLILLTSVGTPPAAAAANSLVVAGEKFALHTIVDRQQGGMVYLALMAPQTWQVSGDVHWKYEDVALPVTSFIQAVNPAKPEALTYFPPAAFVWLQGAAAFNRPGYVALGQMSAQPVDPADALSMAVSRIYRPNVTGLQIIGAREMPRLYQVLKVKEVGTYKGIGLKVQYQENGQAIDEEFYALYYVNQIPYDGPQGRTLQTNWGLDYVHAFKAPHGTLDQRREVFASIVHSTQVSPQWLALMTEIQKQITDQFNRNLAQGYALIDAAGQVSRQISANNDAMIAAMDRQRAAQPRSSPSSPSRSPNDRFDDYVRGVDTVDDPYRGTSQHSNTEQYHWTDGYGNYTHSNDPNFNPNQTSNISWQLMTPSR
jgi:hypothetical protein